MLDMFRSPLRAAIWLVEAVFLVLFVFCAHGVTGGWENAIRFESSAQAVLLSVVAQGSLYYHGLYDPQPLRPSLLFLTTFRALASAGAALFVLIYFLSRHDPPDGGRMFLYALAPAALVLPAWRTAFRHVSNSKPFGCATLVLGSGVLARSCADLLRGGYQMGLLFAGRLVRDDEPAKSDPDIIGHTSELARIVAERRVGLIVVAESDRHRQLPENVLLELKFRGVDIEEGISFYERMTGKIFVPAIMPADLIFAKGFRVRRRTLFFKRILDIACASVGLVLALPVMLMAAIAIKLESQGPILYSQLRSGAFGRAFLMHKFRSMRSDAEANGAVWAVENDPRVTRVGRFIRRTRIDELPQLWNVLRGDMSLVGPRPERPVFIEQLEKEIPFFRQRLFVKPGVTGYAQVRCRYGASVEDALEKLQYDLFYIKRFSIWFDLSILIDTVKVVLLRIGSR
jgi:sugar transferase (PEP-CTERM system associated)